MANTITVDFNANLARFSSAIDKATNDLSRFQTNTARISNNIGKSFDVLRAGLAGIGTTAYLSTVSDFADSYTKLSAQLKIATVSADDFGRAFENVKNIATSAQADIGSIATTYARLGNALKDFGVSQKVISDITETVALSLKTTGASAEEASSAMLQLSQAFGKGKLDGDEFRTAMEATPNLMRSLAESMGVPFGSLKDLAAQGKITSDVLIKAFSNPELLGKLREQAKEIRTISGAYTELKNQMVLLVGETNKATGATSLYAHTIGLVATAIEKVRNSGGLDISIANLIPGGQAIGAIATAVNAAGDAIDSKISQSSSGVIKFAKSAYDTALSFDELTKGLRITSVELEKIRLQEIEAKKSFDVGKISAAQYKDIMAALAKEKDALTKSGKSSSNSIKEDNEALKEFVKHQQEIADLIKRAQSEAAPDKTASQALQDELDSYVNLKPAIHDYIQGLIDIARAKEQWIEMDKLQTDADERQLSALEDSAQAQDDFEKSIQSYIDSVQRSIDPTIELYDNIGKLQSAFSLGLIDQDQLDSMTKFLEDAANKNKKATDDITEFWKEAAHNMQDAMSNFFFDAMQGKLSDLAGNFKATIDRMVANLLASRLTDFLFGADFGKNGNLGGAVGDIFNGSGIGDFFKGLFNANGNAFNQSGLIPFANGGVFGTATPFAFGGGKLGVLGERGPEAILPLKRGANGQLGIQASGGGSATIIMNIQTPDANSFRKSQPQMMAEMQRNLNRGRRIV